MSPDLSSSSSETLAHELLCRRQAEGLLTQFQKIRAQASQKVLFQDLIRAVLVGLKHFYPVASLRVWTEKKVYEAPEILLKGPLPVLTPTQSPLAHSAGESGHSLALSLHETTLEAFPFLRPYAEAGVQQVEFWPFGPPAAPWALLEVTTCEVHLPAYQLELLHWVMRQLRLDLELALTGETSRPAPEKRQPSPEVLQRLRQYEAEKKLWQEREAMFYSLMRYFRETLRMIDAWNYLKSLTPEGQLTQYDFQQHAQRYLEKAFQFSELLVYIHKIQHHEFKLQLQSGDLVAVIHQSLSEFTRHHRQVPLNLRVRLPTESQGAILDSFLLQTAIVYALEHLFLLASHRESASHYVLDLSENETQALITLSLEPDPLSTPWQPQESSFQSYMAPPLDEYGLFNLFLPFVQLAIEAQGGALNQETQGKHLLKLRLTLLKAPTARDVVN